MSALVLLSSTRRLTHADYVICLSRLAYVLVRHNRTIVTLDLVNCGLLDEGTTILMDGTMHHLYDYCRAVHQR